MPKLQYFTYISGLQHFFILILFKQNASDSKMANVWFTLAATPQVPKNMSLEPKIYCIPEPAI